MNSIKRTCLAFILLFSGQAAAMEGNQCLNEIIELTSSVVKKIEAIRAEKEPEARSLLTDMQQGKSEDEAMMAEAIFDLTFEPVYGLHKKIKEQMAILVSAYKMAPEQDVGECKAKEFPKEGLYADYAKAWDMGIAGFKQLYK